MKYIRPYDRHIHRKDKNQCAKEQISMNEAKNEVFAYSYSAKQQEEVRRIRQKYMEQEENKMEQLRRLDASAGKKGTVVSLLLGTLGCLVLGGGMSCCLVWSEKLFIPGIIIGLVGIAGVALAYPAYSRITRKERQRLAPEILRLTEELLK